MAIMNLRPSRILNDTLYETRQAAFLRRGRTQQLLLPYAPVAFLPACTCQVSARLRGGLFLNLLAGAFEIFACTMSSAAASYSSDKCHRCER